MNRTQFVITMLTGLAVLVPSVIQFQDRKRAPCGVLCYERLCEIKDISSSPLEVDAPNGMLTPSELAEALRAASISASPFTSKSADDLMLSTPCIVLLRSSHYVLLLELGHQTAKIWDPDYQVDSLCVSRSKFLSDWTGVGVAIDGI